MNAGLIASRYATALLLFAQEEGMPARVYDDAGALQEALRSPQALATCVEGLSAPMQKFLSLVIRNRRTDYLAAILNSFRTQYRQEYGITRAWLTTAVDNPGLADRLTVHLVTCCNELRTIPVAGSRFDGHAVGYCCNQEYQPSDDSVQSFVIHPFYGLKVSLRVPKILL